MADKAESAANDFASEAKESAKEMKEEWNKMTSNNADNKKVLAGILAILHRGFHFIRSNRSWYINRLPFSWLLYSNGSRHRLFNRRNNLSYKNR